MGIFIEKLSRADDRLRVAWSALSVILVVACCLATAGTVRAAEPDDGWKFLSRGVFVNERNIAFLTNTVTSVWVKVVPDRGSELFSLVTARLRNAGKAFRSFAYTTFLAEIDCAGNRHRELNVIFYGRDKAILHSDGRKEAPWEAIPAGSSLSVVRESVCRAI